MHKGIQKAVESSFGESHGSIVKFISQGRSWIQGRRDNYQGRPGKSKLYSSIRQCLLTQGDDMSRSKIREAEGLCETQMLKFEEIFTSEFMNKYTDYSSIDEMFNKSEFTIESNEDFDKIPVDQLDRFVKENTKFPTWAEMIGTAGEEYVIRKLGL